ncbi:hypothetical protein [Paludisphaera soli]|uniref:hypothetical protein n=1 Tax=Paludisphaera soli TaxID=2712865 RepID=UPI0013EBBAF3|nr:hypothetical protein [Paludisphaera soli]
MPPSLELAQTVAIGAFNPSVITPDWLSRFKVYQERDLATHFDLMSPRAGFEVEIGAIKTKWQVDPQKLIVSSSSRAVDCGAKVAAVLRLLPHTPVYAIGHNFHFRISKQEWEDRPVPTFGDDLKGLGPEGELEQAKWVGTFRLDDVRVEKTVACVAEDVFVFYNFHRSIDIDRAQRATTPEEQISQACEAAERFNADYEVCRGMMGTAFHLEIP